MKTPTHEHRTAMWERLGTVSRKCAKGGGDRGRGGGLKYIYSLKTSLNVNAVGKFNTAYILL